MISDRLPRIRKALLILVVVNGILLTLFSLWLIIFQTWRTRGGYQKSVPALVVVGALSILFPCWFLYSKPFQTSGTKRATVTKFLRSIAFELLVYGGIGAMDLIAVIDLHTDTPGLLESCGKYLICKLLTAVFALAWLEFLFISFAFSALLFSFLYFTLRRRRAIDSMQTHFSEVDWERYATRPILRRDTVATNRKNAKRQQQQHGKGNGSVPNVPPMPLGFMVSSDNLPQHNEKEKVKKSSRASAESFGNAAGQENVFVVVDVGEEDEKRMSKEQEPKQGILIGGAI